MLDPKTFRILKNFVLVKPDDDFETYQLNGQETGIIAPLVYRDEKQNLISLKQQHISISGTVYAIPERLDYFGREIWNIQDNTDISRHTKVRSPEYQKEIDHLRKNSVQFEVPVEVEVGDTVYFEYMAHMLADAEGLWVDTTEGKMMLIKYDLLIMAIRGEHQQMLNGFVLVEPEHVEYEVINGVKQTTTKSGIVLPILGDTEKKSRMQAIGSVVNLAHPVKSYLDFRGKFDGVCFKFNEIGEVTGNDGWAEIGDRIIYDPRHAKELEYGLHRVLNSKRLRRIQRKDIYGIFE